MCEESNENKFVQLFCIKGARESSMQSWGRPWVQAAILIYTLACRARGGLESGVGWAPLSRAPPLPPRANSALALRLRGGVSKFYNVTAPPNRGGVFIQSEGGVVQVAPAACGACVHAAAACARMRGNPGSLEVTGRRSVRME